LPVTVNKHISGKAAVTSAVKTLQTFLGRPVSVQIDHQMRAAEIIKLQQYLVTQGKFSAGNVNKSIDDQRIGAKLIELQNAANLP
jgi:hypothetical protein